MIRDQYSIVNRSKEIEAFRVEAHVRTSPQSSSREAA